MKTKTAVALLAGLAIGAGIALLLAPEKGEELRNKIKKQAKKAGDALQQKAEELAKKIKQDEDIA